jgi:plastocyanin
MKWAVAFSATILSAVIMMSISSPRLAVRADDKSMSEAKVTIDNFSFGPDLKITSGTTVTWTNHDDVPHVVASDAKIFKSQPLDTDDHFSYTFTKPGTYVYYCMIHPRMIAKIVVQ